MIRLSAKRRSPLSKALVYTLLVLGALPMIFPFFWMFSTSLKSYAEAMDPTPALLPKRWLFSNYPKALNEHPLGRYFLNSVIVSVGTTLGVLFTSTLAAYAFCFLKFPGSEWLYMLVLMTMMIPEEVVLIPNFVTIHRLGWYDTYVALIIPWIASGFSIFLLRQFFESLPKELHDAAVLDGCTDWQYLRHVILPLSKAPAITVSIFTFIGAWDALLWPLVATRSEKLRPIQVGLKVFISEFGTDYALLMAASTVAVLPVVLLYAVSQRYFVEGIAETGIR